VKYSGFEAVLVRFRGFWETIVQQFVQQHRVFMRDDIFAPCSQSIRKFFTPRLRPAFNVRSILQSEQPTIYPLVMNASGSASSE
jgi:hypothetical protein